MENEELNVKKQKEYFNINEKKKKLNILFLCAEKKDVTGFYR